MPLCAFPVDLVAAVSTCNARSATEANFFQAKGRQSIPAKKSDKSYIVAQGRGVETTLFQPARAPSRERAFYLGRKASVPFVDFWDVGQLRIKGPRTMDEIPNKGPELRSSAPDSKWIYRIVIAVVLGRPHSHTKIS